MKNTIITSIILAVVFVCEARHFPSHFQKCKKTDILDKCLATSLNEVWPKIVQDYNLEAIPIKYVKKMVPNFVTGVISEGFFLGYDTIKFNNIYVDFQNKTFDVVYSQPLFTFTGKYFARGRFLEVSLNDRGNATMTYGNGIYKYHFDYKLLRHDGEQYIKINEYELELEPGYLTINMTSDVDPNRGKLYTNLMNNNWRILHILIGRTVADVMATTYTPIIQELLNNVPFNSIFE